MYRQALPQISGNGNSLFQSSTTLEHLWAMSIFGLGLTKIKMSWGHLSNVFIIVFRWPVACLCQPTPLHEVAYAGMVSKGFLREPTRCRLCLRGYDSLLFPIVAWCLAVQLGCWELLLGRWWRRGSRRSRGGRRLTLQLTNAKVNGFQLLSTSVYAKPTPCRLNQAYATAYPTYAVCMEAYATGILKHVLSSSHSIYCLASRKKKTFGVLCHLEISWCFPACGRSASTAALASTTW